VIGLPDDERGNVVHAIVEADAAEVSQAALLEFLADRLVSYKLPRSVEYVDEPLRDAAGKVRRRALRAARLSRPEAGKEPATRRFFSLDLDGGNVPGREGRGVLRDRRARRVPVRGR